MASEPLSVLAIGAHPDDCDMKMGGTACLYTDRGHEVQFLSMTDGGAGHHELAGSKLVQRRHAEATAAADIAGVEFTMFENPDGRLQPSLSNRDHLIEFIRETDPDLVVTHRPNDYHPDHRYTAQLVRDAAYMVTVPNICPRTPALDDDPVFAYFADEFSRPYSFSPDVVVGIDEVIDRKFAMLDCHESQMYEWLPSNEGNLDSVPEAADARLKWLRAGGVNQVAATTEIAERFRESLITQYGNTVGHGIEHAEAFEISEYGSRMGKVKQNFPLA